MRAINVDEIDTFSQFYQSFFARFLFERRFGSFFLVTFGLEPKFCTKKRAKNVDEIDTLCGFDFLLHKINYKSPTLTKLTSYRLKFIKKNILTA